MADLSNCEAKPITNKHDESQSPNWWRNVSAVVIYIMFAGAIFCWLMPSLPQAPDPFEVALVALVLALSAMSTSALSLWGSLARFPVIVFIFGMLAYILTSKIPPDTPLILYFLPASIGLPILFMLETIKFFGGRFQRRGNNEFREGLQFGIRHLIIATSLVAAICAIGRLIAPFVIRIYQSDSHLLNIIVAISTLLSFNTLLGVWALLGTKIGYRIWVCLILQVIAIPSCVQLMIAPSASVWMLIFSVATASTLVLLGALRYDGYRFVKQ